MDQDGYEPKFISYFNSKMEGGFPVKIVQRVWILIKWLSLFKVCWIMYLVLLVLYLVILSYFLSNCGNFLLNFFMVRTIWTRAILVVFFPEKFKKGFKFGGPFSKFVESLINLFLPISLILYCCSSLIGFGPFGSTSFLTFSRNIWTL